MIVRKKLKYLKINIIGLTLLVLSGCTTLRLVEIEELVPADITLPSSVKVLGLINPNFPDDVDTALSSHVAEYLRESNLTSTEITESVLKGFRDVMAYSPRFRYVDIHSDLEIPSDTTDYMGLSLWEQIRKVSHDSVVDALVTIRVMDFVDNVYVAIHEDIDLELEGTIEVTNTCKVLDPVEMKVIDNHTYTLTGYGYSESDYLDILFNMRSSRRRAALDACFWSGQEYAFRITPVWETTTRRYYTWPGDVSKRAKEFVSKDDWLSAARIWKSETTSSKRSAAAMACFNMALACEIEDNLEMSLYWVKQSDSLQPYRIATQDYIQLLEDRLKERATLDQQITIE
ncbi:MAG TPA: DUF6340 family protein [Bacteroidales bacterium]|nr:DUF6340 family protein [Bacteroidales bacterium]HNS47326.1 DUF6340 family protein [Bacteroidales bacterium]